MPAASGGTVAAAPSQPRRQIVLRIFVLLFALLGAGGAGFLGAVWLVQYHEQVAKLKEAEPMLQFGRALGMDANAENVARYELSKLIVKSYLLMAVAGLAFLWGLWLAVSQGSGFLPGMMILAGVAAAGILEPKTLIFTGFLILVGLLCLFIRGAKRSLVGNLLTGTLALGFLAVPMIALYQPNLLGITQAPPMTFATVGNSLTPMGMFGEPQENSSIPARGKETVHGEGFASPEEALDQFAKSVLALDVDGYKKWLAGSPDDLNRFNRMAQGETEGGKKSKEFAEKQMAELVRAEWIKGRTKKSPVVPDGEEYASIVFQSKPIGDFRRRADFQAVCLQEEQRPLVSDRRKQRAAGKPEGALSGRAGAAAAMSFPPKPRWRSSTTQRSLAKLDEKIPKDAAAARQLLQKKYEKAQFDGDGKLVSLGSDFGWITDLSQQKAMMTVLSPTFKDKGLSFLAAAYFSDADMEKLAGLTGLEKLDISGPTQITDKGMASLKGLTNLKKLELESPYVTDAGLVHLKGMKNLEELKLRVRITDAGLAQFAGMTNLKELHLQGGYVAGPGLAHLKGCSQLNELGLNGNRMTGQSIVNLAAVPGVKQLLLQGNYIDDAGLAALPKALPLLGTLALDGNEITDQGLEALPKLHKLKYLSLASNRITGPGLAHIKKIAEAEGIFKGSLDVRKNPLNDSAVEHLAALEKTGSVQLQVDSKILDKIHERLKTADHIGSVFAIAFAPDGKTAATGGTDQTIKLWDLATGRPRDTLRRHSSAVHVVAFAPDGNLLASGGRDSNAYLWEIHAGKSGSAKSSG